MSEKPTPNDLATVDQLRLQLSAANLRAALLCKAVLVACVDGDYCYACERHPSSSGHALACPTRDP